MSNRHGRETVDPHEQHLTYLGQGITAMEAGRDTALYAATTLENVALFEQLGKLTREIDTLKRMVQQHRIDRA